MLRFTNDNNVTSQSNFQNLNAANPVTNSLQANAFYNNVNQQDNPSTFTEKYNDDDQINESTKDIKGELNKHSEVINIADYVDYQIIPYNKTFNTQSNCKFNTHMMAKLSVGEIESETKASIDLICVIDKSGSMQGNKIKLLIDSFNSILEYLGPNDRVSVVSFSHQATRLTPLLAMNPENKLKLLKELNNVRATGGTNISSGVHHALEILSQRRYVNQATSILVLSDGQDSGADSQIKELLKKYDNKTKSDFIMNTFGYGDDHNPDLMTRISSFKDGSFYYVDKLEKVDECFIDCLGGLISIVAEDINFQIIPEGNQQSVKITKAYGPENFWKSLENGGYVAKQINMISGKSYHFVFDVEIDNNINFEENVEEFVIASSSSKFKGIRHLNNSEEYTTKNANCSLSLVKENHIDDPLYLNLGVLEHFYRVKSTEIIDLARQLAENHKYQEAEQILINFKEDMKYSLVKDKEIVVNIMKDIDTAIHNVKPTIFNVQGKNFMVENAYCNMRERSNQNSQNCYANMKQAKMLEDLRSKKI